MSHPLAAALSPETRDFVLEHRLVKSLTPFIVATEPNRAGLNTAPFGLKVARRNRIDPTRMDSEGFCALLQNLDGRTFGPEGMPMDRWVFYDCCYMPGAIFGFGRPVETVPRSTRDLLGVPEGYDGLVPYSMYIAIPMATADLDTRAEGAQPTSWMGHNLASIAPILKDEDLKGLGTITKAIALRAFGVRQFFGATQWDTHALHVHAKFGPLELHTAYTPAHSEAKTLTYAFEVNDNTLLAAMGAPGIAFERPAPELWVHPEDVTTMVALQDRIEAGERFVIPTAPRADGAVPVTPVMQSQN
jgi:hypothetical protein